MSIFRRPTRAAGYSWRKWEDPIVYAAPTEARLIHLACWALLGAAAAFVAILVELPVPNPDVEKFLIANFAAVALALVAFIGIGSSWNAMTAYEQ